MLAFLKRETERVMVAALWLCLESELQCNQENMSCNKVSYHMLHTPLPAQSGD